MGVDIIVCFDPLVDIIEVQRARLKSNFSAPIYVNEENKPLQEGHTQKPLAPFVVEPEFTLTKSLLACTCT